MGKPRLRPRSVNFQSLEPNLILHKHFSFSAAEFIVVCQNVNYMITFTFIYTHVHLYACQYIVIECVLCGLVYMCVSYKVLAFAVELLNQGE